MHFIPADRNVSLPGCITLVSTVGSLTPDRGTGSSLILTRAMVKTASAELPLCGPRSVVISASVNPSSLARAMNCNRQMSVAEY